jgi:hypothetical protein
LEQITKSALLVLLGSISYVIRKPNSMKMSGLEMQWGPIVGFKWCKSSILEYELKNGSRTAK